MAKLLFFIAALWLLHASLAIQPTAKFFSKRLKTYRDCQQYSRQSKYAIARCDGYYSPKKKTFFIDDRFNVSVVECGQLNEDGRLPTIIYEVKGIKDFSENDVMVDMIQLEVKLDRYVEIVPQITCMLGPGGDKSTIAVNLGRFITSWAVIAPAEKENRLAYYPQVFFDQLYMVETIPVAYKYLMLNGWHLRNIPYIPELNEEFFNIFSGIIIRVEREHAHLINKKEVTAFLNSTIPIPIWFDMPGSPDFAGSSILGHSSILFWVIIILAYFN